MDSQGRDGVFAFWTNFFKDGQGLNHWERLKADRAKAAQKVRLEQGSKTWAERAGTVRSHKRRLDERSAPIQTQEKRPRQERVQEELLPFAVYVEKFDSNQSRIKITASEWDQIRSLVINAYWLESSALKSDLKNDVEKRAYNGEIVIFYTKSETAQAFVIKAINGNLPGIQARGPRVIISPNFHVEFPAVLDRMQSELVIAKAISMHVGVAQVQIRNVKKNDKTGR